MKKKWSIGFLVLRSSRQPFTDFDQIGEYRTEADADIAANKLREALQLADQDQGLIVVAEMKSVWRLEDPKKIRDLIERTKRHEATVGLNPIDISRR